jgi:hypothetical protein
MTKPFYHERVQPNETRARELILYVAELTGQDESFGSTKLNKALCHADFSAFALNHEPLTGMEYQKNELGPTLRFLLPILRGMQAEGLIRVEQSDDPVYQETRVVALRPADVSLFSDAERTVIERSVNRIRPLGGKEASDLSHEFPGWVLAELGETIPYEAVFWNNRDLYQDEIAYGLELAQRYG